MQGSRLQLPTRFFQTNREDAKDTKEEKKKEDKIKSSQGSYYCYIKRQVNISDRGKNDGKEGT